MSSSRYTLTACGADGVITVHEPLAALAATEVQVAVDYSMVSRAPSVITCSRYARLASNCRWAIARPGWLAP